MLSALRRPDRWAGIAGVRCPHPGERLSPLAKVLVMAAACGAVRNLPYSCGMLFSCDAGGRWHTKAGMKTRSLTHFVYLVTIAVKGIDGVIETLLGLLIAATGPDRLYALVLRFT